MQPGRADGPEHAARIVRMRSGRSRWRADLRGSYGWPRDSRVVGWLARLSEDLAPESPGVMRVLFAVALVCWAIVLLLHALLPAGFSGSVLLALSAYWAVAAVAFAAVVRTVQRAKGAGRFLWSVLALALIFGFAGHASRAGFQMFDLARPVLVPHDVLFGVSYLLFFCALTWLVAKTTRRITLIAALDAASVMLSVGLLVWRFVLGPAASEAGLDGPREVFVALSGPVCDAGLLCLALVVVSGDPALRYAVFVVGAFSAYLVADGVYLTLSSQVPYEVGGWVDLVRAAGVALFGVAALNADASGGFVRRLEVDPWAVVAFWLSPLSPAVHLAFLLAWGALVSPLPPYGLAGGAVLASYFAFRIGMASYASRKLRLEAARLAKRAEQVRLSEELHDTLKQSVYSTALLLDSYKRAREKRGPEAAEEVLERAVAASREAKYRVGRPIDELRTLGGAPGLDPAGQLRGLLDDARRYFGLDAHEDLRADPDLLDPEELAAAIKIASEALWNAGKHARAKNVWLESRVEGSAVVVRVRDDGRGFRADDSTAGMGLSLMRSRAEGAGGELGVISEPGRGTIVRVSFDEGRNGRSDEG